MYYAQIDENNICVGISDLSGAVDAPDMILLDAYDLTLMGKQYDNETGAWLEVEQTSLTTPVTNEEIAEQLLVIMDAQADIYETIIEGGL